mgnify:CR=1 FL=1
MHSHLQGHPGIIQAIKHLERLNPDQFEIYYENRIATKIDSKDQKVDSLSRSEDVGISIRLIKDKKLGFSFTTSLDSQSIQNAIETASEIANWMPEDPYHSLHSFGSSVYPSVDNFDTQGLKVPLADKISLAKSLEDQCRKADPRITSVRLASVSENSTETFLIDSQGETVQHKNTVYTASVTCKAESQGDSQVGSEFSFSNYLDNLEINSVAQLSAQWAIELLGARTPPTLRCPAILRNSVVADLLEFLSDSFSAEQIDKGRSMLAAKLGQMVFSEQVTLINDGLRPGGLGTTPFDAEGIPTRRVHLAENGFMAGILYDTYHARKKGETPTGSSVRGIKSPPSIGLSNFYMQAGRKSFHSLLDGISEGILITDLMGVHTANPVTGDFSLGASGIMIKNSKLTYPVRGFAVAGNILEVFRRMTDISNDIRFFGRIGAPSVRLSEISVGGS